MTDQPGYIELHAASAFSFLEGASQPEGLIRAAVETEMPAMALLDRNGFYGAARFHASAKENGVRAHIGAEIAMRDLGERLRPPRMVAASAHPGVRPPSAALHLAHRLSESLPAHHSIQDEGAA